MSKPKHTGPRSRIVSTGTAAPADLKPHPRNWRIHEQAQRAAVAGLLDEVGYVKRVIVNKRSGYILDGHLRVALAVERGEKTVPVDWVNLSEAEEIKILVALDTTVGLAKTDDDLLAALRSEIETESPGLAALITAMGEHALASPLGEAFGVEPSDEEAPAPPGVNLTDRFGLPPFSVLNAREGWWQDRKRAWLALGIQSELGRGIENLEQAHPATTSTIDFYALKRALEAEVGRDLTTPEARALLAERGLISDAREENRARKFEAIPGGAGAGAVYRRGGAKANAVPGGGAMPAADYSKKQRGDGRGRPLV